MNKPAEQAITATIGGLKCDTPSCEYRDDSITVDQYERYINAPCPECGASLLTPGDFATVQHTLAITAFVNSLSPEDIAALSGLSLKDMDHSGKATMTLELNGTGDVNMTITTEEGGTK